MPTFSATVVAAFVLYIGIALGTVLPVTDGERRPLTPVVRRKGRLLVRSVLGHKSPWKSPIRMPLEHAAWISRTGENSPACVVKRGFGHAFRRRARSQELKVLTRRRRPPHAEPARIADPTTLIRSSASASSRALHLRQGPPPRRDQGPSRHHPR
jgi:hypothetical protein